MRGAVALALLLVAAPPATAQVTLDGSLGPAGSVPLVSGEYAIGDDLGSYAGPDNLFHSFSSFDVNSGETANFSAGIGMPKRVIARVTGGDGTAIAGTLRSSIPEASLFLLDPLGIEIFGESARIDVDGSFYASTADVLRFESGADLLVADATPDPILSTAAPAAFGFTSASPAPVSIGSSNNQFSVPAGETLSFVGGDVIVFGDPGGGFAPFVINAPGAHLEIAAAAGPVEIPVSLQEFDLASVDPAALGTVNVISASISVSSSGTTRAGSVLIRGGQFVLEAGSQILATHAVNGVDAAGPVDIAVAGELRLSERQEGLGPALIQTASSRDGRGGDVLLTGETVVLEDQARVQLDQGLFLGGTSTHAADGPDLHVSGRVITLDSGATLASTGSSTGGTSSSIALVATEEASLRGGAVIDSRLRIGHLGEEGVISIDSPMLTIEGDAQILSRNQGAGAGTRIELSADTLAIRDAAGIVSWAEGSGPGGATVLEADSVSVTAGGIVGSGTSPEAVVGARPGGPIAITADRVLVSNDTGSPDNAIISANNGGSITIDADLVELLDGGQILTRTFTAAPAGALRVVGADLVRASGVDAQDRPAGLFSRTRESATASGTGGLLSVETRALEVLDGGELSSSTLGPAAAGAVEIHANERVSVRGGPNGVSLISASALPGSSGNGGSIGIETDQLELRDGGQVTTSTFSLGDGGVIEAHAREIEISGVDPLSGLNPSGFFSRSNTAVAGAGDGGNIGLFATQSLRMRDGAVVSVSSSGEGLAGDVLVDGGNRFEMQSSMISTQALASSGGNVKVAADTLVYLYGSEIKTDVINGDGGGGDVSIDPVHTVLNHSSITANAEGMGAGGNLQIVSDHYFPSGDSFLMASSRLGVDGTIEISSPVTDLTGALARLPASYLDASALLANECAARTERAGSFAVRVREALPAAPDAALTPMDCEEFSPVQENP